MPRILRTPQSRADLVEIILYIRRDNRRAARRWLLTIDEKLRCLADFPGIGRARPELGRGLRSFPVGNYILFYRPTNDGIELIRVLHGARKVRPLLKGR